MLFGWDKIRAEKFQWRIAERTLLRYAMLGGSIGAYTGRTIFRHKTRKQPFNANLQKIGFIQIVILTFVAVFVYSPADLSSDMPKLELSELAYYPNCDWARSFGAAPIKEGEPGYRFNLDRDGDGIACEPYRGRY